MLRRSLSMWPSLSGDSKVAKWNAHGDYAPLLFGERCGGGLPLIEGSAIVGWICSTINNRWSYVLNPPAIDKSPRFYTEEAAKFELLLQVKSRQIEDQSKAVNMWRACDGMTEPVEVFCPKGIYSKQDADGFDVFKNTHYFDEDSAWSRLQVSVEAGLSLATKDLQRAKSEVIYSEKLLQEAQIEMESFKAAYALRYQENNDE